MSAADDKIKQLEEAIEIAENVTQTLQECYEKHMLETIRRFNEEE